MASEIKVDTISEKTSAGGVTIDGLLIKDGGISGDVSLIGTTPTFTIGDAGAEDAALVFDGNAQDFYIGLDDSADDLVIGLGSTVGTTPAISINEDRDVTISDGAIDFDVASHDTSNGLKLGGTLVTATAAELNIMDGVTATAAEINLIDGGTSRGTTALADGDGILINDAGTMRMTNVTAVKTYMSTTLAGIDDQSSSNDDQITIADGAVTINEDSDDVDFRVETNGLTHAIFADGGADRIGFGTVPSLGLVHIQSSDVGGDVSIHADELVIENNGTCGITILSANDSGGSIHFGDDGDNDIGKIVYDHGSNDMTFTTNSTERLRIQDTGPITTNGETAGDADPGGITLNQGANDANILTFKSSDVAHGMTGAAETDTWCKIKKWSATEGGLLVWGFSEGAIATRLRSYATGEYTTKSTSTGANIMLDARERGTTSAGAHGSDGNLVTIQNDDSIRFIFDAEGDFHADSSSTTFDAYDDAQLVRAFDLSRGKGVVDSKFDKFVAYNHEHLADLKLVGREKDGTPNHFINVNGMQRLHNGAIWQQYEKHNQLLEAVYDLAKLAVGKDKANAILDKHEVKRLQ